MCTISSTSGLGSPQNLRGRALGRLGHPDAGLFPAAFLCARAVRAHRFPARGSERWGWRIALAGYGL
jgi:hypothetical protein